VRGSVTRGFGCVVRAVEVGGRRGCGYGSDAVRRSAVRDRSGGTGADSPRDARVGRAYRGQASPPGGGRSWPEVRRPVQLRARPGDAVGGVRTGRGQPRGKHTGRGRLDGHRTDHPQRVARALTSHSHHPPRCTRGVSVSWKGGAGAQSARRVARKHEKRRYFRRRKVRKSTSTWVNKSLSALDIETALTRVSAVQEPFRAAGTFDPTKVDRNSATLFRVSELRSIYMALMLRSA